MNFTKFKNCKIKSKFCEIRSKFCEFEICFKGSLFYFCIKTKSCVLRNTYYVELKKRINMKTKFLQKTKRSSCFKSLFVVILVLGSTINVQAWPWLDKSSNVEYDIWNTSGAGTTGDWMAQVTKLPEGCVSIAIPSTIGFTYESGGKNHSAAATVVKILALGGPQRQGNLTQIELPPTIKSIGDGIFSYNRNVYHVVAPGDTLRSNEKLQRVTALYITEVGLSTFENCPALTSLNIPIVETIGNKAFKNCTALKSISLPETLKSIGDNAFEGCTAMTSFTIPESVLSISNRAFMNTPITSLRLPKGLKNVVSETFFGSSIATIYYDCEQLQVKANPMFIPAFDSRMFPSLTNVYIGNAVRNIEGIFINSNVKNVTIPEGMENIKSAFSNCRSLQTITVPSSVTTASTAFSDCVSLKEITVLGNTIYGSEFKGCTNLEAFTILYNITRIEGSAFEKSGLRTITIPASVKITGVYTFASCPNLEEVIIRNDTIEERQFWDCGNIKKVDMSENIKAIRVSAFYRCGNLEKIDIPASIQSIGEYAFGNCTGLKEITVHWQTPLNIYSHSVFSEVTISNVKLRVPRGTMELYKSAYVWKSFKIEENIELSSAPSSTSALVSWYEVLNAASYKLDVFTDEARTQLFNSYNLDAQGKLRSMNEEKLSYTVQGLSPQTDYFYTLTAYDANQNVIGTYENNFVTLLLNGINENKNIAVGFYPNPVIDHIYITNSTKKASIKIIDLNGIILINNRYHESGIDVSHLPTGLYLLQIALPEGEVVTEKFIKR